MCTHCNNQKLVAPKKSRLRIWEIEPGWHCSIIGTCLSLSEINNLAKKMSLNTVKKKTLDVDAYLHGYFVKEAGNNSVAAKFLNKVLNKKFAHTIKQFQKLKDIDKLSIAWDKAFEEGNIPGPYWAVMSHHLTEEELGLRAYGHVHMLSHLVGSSNRADRLSIQRLENQNIYFNDCLEREKLRSRKKIEKKEFIIKGLKNEISALKNKLSKISEKIEILDPKNIQPKKTIKVCNQKIDKLEFNLNAANAKIRKLQSVNYDLSSSVPILETEAYLLEEALTQKSDTLKKSSFNLNGNCILYVGGRSREVCRLQTLVSTWNGKLFHHDGGIERSMNELIRAISKADAVVFPINCVSHNASLKVKKLCRQSMKPFVPLRSTGLASLINGLRDELGMIVA